MGQEAPSIVYVVGARPNFVKMAPVISELRSRAPTLRHVVIHTGQHYDADMSEIFFSALAVPEPDHQLNVGSGSHGAQTGRALERIEVVLEAERPELVIVPGDVNSTLAGALAAVKLGLPVAHLEAGLRSFDRAMPEEINRLLVDQLSRWCFIHSREAETNLLREGIEGDRIFFVGNTMIDTLVRMIPRAVATNYAETLAVRPRSFLLVTLHRPSLVDGPLFESVLAELAELSRRMPVVFPLHPRTRQRVQARRRVFPDNLHLIDPLGYLGFLALQRDALGVLTDSGGVQEETTYLRVPCFTLRANTERPVTLTHGTNQLLGVDPASIRRIPDLLAHGVLPLEPPEGWDGRASERVADVLASTLGFAAQPRQQTSDDVDVNRA